jgi:hypothetical protein
MRHDLSNINDYSTSSDFLCLQQSVSTTLSFWMSTFKAVSNKCGNVSNKCGNVSNKCGNVSNKCGNFPKTVRRLACSVTVCLCAHVACTLGSKHFFMSICEKDRSVVRTNEDRLICSEFIILSCSNCACLFISAIILVCYFLYPCV